VAEIKLGLGFDADSPFDDAVKLAPMQEKPQPEREGRLTDRARHRVDLMRLDRLRKRPIAALTHLQGPPNGKASRPHLFLAANGRSYWVKTKAQRGLFPEYAIGQLAALVGAGPGAELISVQRSALPLNGTLDRFEGTFVGSEHVPGAVNIEEFGELVTSGLLDPQVVDARSRARTIAFQTWVNAMDEQVLVRLEDGVVLTIDHGDCLSALPPGPPSRIVVAPIGGLSGTVGRDWRVVSEAVDAITAISEGQILEIVAGLENLDGWQAPFERRLMAARWLIKRQQKLGEELGKWAPRLS
jgi:hypothetical protein